MFYNPDFSRVAPPLVLLFALLWAISLPAWAQATIPEGGFTTATNDHRLPLLDYDLRVEMDPERHRLTATATVTLPPGFPRRFALALHRGLNPRVLEPGVTLAPAAGRAGGGGRTAIFNLSLPPGQDSFTLEYAGEIHHPLGFAGQDYARGVRHTPGRIDPDGIYLGPAAHWYPNLLTDDHFLRFRLRIKLPPGWAAVSQGRLLAEPQPAAAPSDLENPAAVWRHLRAARAPEETVWEETLPQQGIFLVADRFKVFRDQVTLPRRPTQASPAAHQGDPTKPTTHDPGGPTATADHQGERQVTTLVYLRDDDPELARRYLAATADYLRHYSEMLGPYPYHKFAMVENAWESGFGMPSFTLLGSRVIRLPFILHTSYPHEILHNWWGNGVFTDHATGNWSEGLTAYLADHRLMAEQGRGAEYRLGVLQKYADYAAEGRDFPLRRFTSRHDSATEAVGYGKGLMLFHMLRQKLGEKVFLAGLRDFYQHHQFTKASYADLQRSFEGRAGHGLDDFFRPWLERSGAPELYMESVTLEEDEPGWRLQATFGQRQAGEPYRLWLPLQVEFADKTPARRFQIPLTGEQTDWQATFAQRPRQLALDPDFDLFRRLDRREIPPAFSRLYGRQDRLLVLLPSRVGPRDTGPRDRGQQLLAAYRELARALQRFGSAGVEVMRDDELTELPPGRGVILLGRHNRFQPRVAEILPRLEAALKPDGSLMIATDTYPTNDHAFALALPRPPEAAATLGWIVMDQPEMLPHLLRRLPHYHRYGALVFQGRQAANILRHHWPTPASPLRQDL